MAFCGKCGVQMNDDAKFCPACGQPVAAAQQAQPEQQPQYEQAAYTQYQPPVMPGAPQQADIRDAQENKTMSILAYILFFIPLLTGAHKNSVFAKFHTNQGTVLFLAAVIWGVAYGILSAILVFIPVVGWLLMLIIGLTGFVFLALCIVGIINAANGRMQPLPVIGKYTVIK